MVCNCNENIIKCTRGTSLNLTFTFEDDLTGYSALFVVRKNYQTEPSITIDIPSITGNTFDVNLTPVDTNNLTEFKNGENQASYIWGLDLINANSRISAFPVSGDSAPLFLAYRHVAEE